VLLGAMSGRVPGFGPREWKAAVEKHVPGKFLDANLAAFDRGKEAAG